MRLIDANELEIELTKQKAHLMDKSYHTTIESDRMMYINTATGLIHAINILQNAPTVEPEPYFEKAEKDKRIYERGFEDGQNARPQGDLISFEEVLKSIEKQYTEHNELVPSWLHIGHIKSEEEPRQVQTPSCLTDEERHAELLERYKEGGAE